MAYSDEREPLEQERLKTGRKRGNKEMSFFKTTKKGDTQNLREGLSLDGKGFVSCRKV